MIILGPAEPRALQASPPAPVNTRSTAVVIGSSDVSSDSDLSLIDLDGSDNTLTDSVSTDSDGHETPPSDFDSDVSVEGLPGSHYGGWGTCFRCGDWLCPLTKGPLGLIYTLICKVLFSVLCSS